MDPVVIWSTAAPDPEAVAELARLGVATAHEAMGRRGLADPRLHPLLPGVRIAGRAVTVLAQPGDNLMIHTAVEQCRPGDILVVTTTSASTDGMFGELLAVALQKRGVAGIVIDAGVRDVAELRRMAYPVWSRAVSAQGTVKATPGSVNVPVVLAGTAVQPGDVIVADDDGVLVVARADAKDVATAGARRAEKEAGLRERLAAGEPSLDVFGLRELLVRLGVRYEER